MMTLLHKEPPYSEATTTPCRKGGKPFLAKDRRSSLIKGLDSPLKEKKERNWTIYKKKTKTPNQKEHSPSLHLFKLTSTTTSLHPLSNFRSLKLQPNNHNIHFHNLQNAYLWRRNTANTPHLASSTQHKSILCRR